MIIAKPSINYKNEFLHMLEDYSANDPESGKYYLSALDDFPKYIQSLLNEEDGIKLINDNVPCSHRWLLDGAQNIVGIVRIRHNINTKLLAEEYGHIGYDVPPAFRRRGYGIKCLQAGLHIAKILGIQRVYIFCDSMNIPSSKTIERCGGILELERYSDYFQTMIRKYYIDIPNEK